MSAAFAMKLYDQVVAVVFGVARVAFTAVFVADHAEPVQY